uniref:Uncharacterized protein n=1 Tax=Lygus hesperus TaxID=30085 RepID=A0A146LUL2_LYGHE
MHMIELLISCVEKQLNTMTFTELAQTIALVHTAQLLGANNVDGDLYNRLSSRVGEVLHDGVLLEELGVICVVFAFLPRAYPPWFSTARSIALHLIQDQSLSQPSSMPNGNTPTYINDITRLRLALSFPSDEGFA